MARQSLFKAWNLFGSQKLFGNNILPLTIVQPTSGLKKEAQQLVEGLNIPAKPKRPVTPFFKFISDHRESVLSKNPNLKVQEIVRKCSEEWKTAHETIKQKYIEQYEIEKKKYTQEILDYESKLTLEQQAALKQLGAEKRKSKARRKLKKELKSTDKPKRPLSAFTRYVIDQAKARNWKYSEALVQLKGKWSEEPESVKIKYIEQYQDEEKAYKVELEAWERKMIEQGKVHLLPKKVADRLVDKTESGSQSKPKTAAGDNKPIKVVKKPQKDPQ